MSNNVCNMPAPPPDEQTNVAAVKEGTVFSLLRYCTVTEVRDREFTVKTDDGNVWQVDKEIVRKSCYTADQVRGEPKEVTPTQLAAVFERAGDHVWSLCFRKKPDADVVADAFLTVDEDVRAMSQAKRRKLARSMLAGEQRVMTGRFKTHTPDVNGRYRVMDLDLNAERHVDPRTLEWFIYSGTKYVVK